MLPGTNHYAAHLRHACYYYSRAVAIIQIFIEQHHMASALTRFDQERAQVDTAIAWLSQCSGQPDTDLLLVNYTDALAYLQGLRYDFADSYHQRLTHTLAAARRLGAQGAESRVLGGLGASAAMRGDTQAASTYLEQALTLARRWQSP